MTYGEYTTIEYDHREGDDDIIEFMEFDFEYNMEKINNMKMFDYLQGDCGIERKSVADFISSYRKDEEEDTSIWRQCNNMVSQDEVKPYVIIVGAKRHIEAYFNKRHENIANGMSTYYGAVGSVAARYGFPVLTVEDSYGFANLAAKIFHSHRHGKVGKIRAMSVTSASKYSAVAKILALVPGINMQALQIVDQLNLTVPREIFTLMYDDLLTVDGIGRKKAEAIIDFLGI